MKNTNSTKVPNNTEITVTNTSNNTPEISEISVTNNSNNTQENSEISVTNTQNNTQENTEISVTNNSNNNPNNNKISETFTLNNPPENSKISVTNNSNNTPEDTETSKTTNKGLTYSYTYSETKTKEECSRENSKTVTLINETLQTVSEKLLICASKLDELTTVLVSEILSLRTDCLSCFYSCAIASKDSEFKALNNLKIKLMNFRDKHIKNEKENKLTDFQDRFSTLPDFISLTKNKYSKAAEILNNVVTLSSTSPNLENDRAFFTVRLKK